jgi:hypothetical protein
MHHASPFFSAQLIGFLIHQAQGIAAFLPPSVRIVVDPIS